MDALLNQPDRRTSLGVRDHVLLLFLYNSGARADEAAKLTVGNLELGASPSVRLHGKGNKVRICPLWSYRCRCGVEDIITDAVPPIEFAQRSGDLLDLIRTRLADQVERRVFTFTSTP